MNDVAPTGVEGGVVARACQKRSKAWLVFLIVLAISLSFACYTHHAWEDFYITYRCSKNLAMGQGLVFTPGQHVHAFTSPLNVLIPSALSYALGNKADILVLWLFRILSASSLACAAVLLYKIARWQHLQSLATFVLIGLFATNIRIVDFSVNGQETGFMMFFLALTLHSLIVPARWSTLRLGIAWAGLMWTRPDGFVYASTIAGAFFLFNAGSSGDRTRLRSLKDYMLAATIAAVLYGPWVIWASSYYGNPIPHTIIAKGTGIPMGFRSVADRTLSFLLMLFQVDTTYTDSFAPIYYSFGGWPNVILFLSGCLALPAAWYWVLPFGQRQTRAISLAFLLGTWYLNVVTVNNAPWYFPNIAILAVCVIGQLVQQFSDLLERHRDRLTNDRLLGPLRSLFWTCVVAMPVFTVAVLIASAVQLRIQQREIEDSTRMQIGLWLSENARSPKDTVFLECLGYIGYFSGLTMLDYPGLSSPEVVAVRNKYYTNSYARIIEILQPDWLVLRPIEVRAIWSDDDGAAMLGEQYQLAKVFDASQRIKSYALVPGIDYLLFDSVFFVFKRNRAG